MKETSHRGHPSSFSFVAFSCHALCSIATVSRRHEKNTKLLKTNTKITQ